MVSLRVPRIVSVRVDHLTLGSADYIVTVLTFKNFMKFSVRRLPWRRCHMSQRLGVGTVGKWEILVLMKLTWTPLFPIHTHGQEKEQAGLSSFPVKHNP